MRSPWKGTSMEWVETVAIKYDSGECLKWPFGSDANGYGQLNIDGRGTTYAHRYICERTYGSPPTISHQAAHSCGNGHLGCVNPNHIRWATRSENYADCLIHGTHVRGTRHGMSRLTEDDIREIRNIPKSMTLIEIGRIFGIAPQTVSKIRRRERWGWLQE